MKVILRQDIDTLGDKDEIKTVAAGYARNYLIPRGLAVLADEKNLKDHERRLLFAKRREDKLELTLVKAADKIRGAKIVIEAHAGLEGKLYGSVTTREIAAALTEKFKMEIDKKRIKLHEPIKKIGEYPVSFKLKDSHTADVIVVVVPDANSDKPEEKPAEAEQAEAAAETAAEQASETDAAEEKA